MSLLGDDVVVRSVEDALESGQDPSPLCRNCDAPLDGPFCSECGQKAGSLHISLWEFAREALDNVISFDSRVWRTLRPLVLRPGFLSTEYLAGRRARYVPPLRLYLFISFVVFVVQSWMGDASTVVQFNGGLAEGVSGGEVVLVDDGSAVDPDPDPVPEAVADEPAGEQESGEATTDDSESAEPLPEADGNSTEQERAGGDVEPGGLEPGSAEPQDVGSGDAGSGAGPSTGQRTIAEEFSDENLAGTPAPLRWFLQKVVRRAAEEPERFGAEFMRRLPWAFFLLVPWFAVLLRIFFRRIERYYVPHLVVALHFHCYAFVLVLAGNLVDWISGTEVGSLLTVGGMVVGLLATLRRVYGQGWVRITLKAGVLAFVHLLALSFAMVLLVLVTGVSLSG